MSDGTIRFDTKIETDALKKQLDIIKKDITKTNKDIAKSESRIADLNTKKNNEIAGSTKNKIQADINKEMDKLAALQKQFKDQSNEQIMVQNEKAAIDKKIEVLSKYDSEISKITNKLNTMQERSNTMKMMGDIKRKPFAKLQIEIDRTKAKLDELIAKKQLVESGDVKSSSFKDKLTSIVNSIKNAGNEINKNHFGKFANDSNKAINALKEGFNNLVKYSSTTQNSMNQLVSSFTYLKNALATLVAPILNLIAPIFSRIIDYIAKTISAVAQLIALLTGKNTFTKAVKTQEKYGTALGGSAKQAKKLNKELEQTAHIDELNVIDKQDNMDDIDVGDSGGSGSGNVGKMFEEAAIDDKIKAFADKLKKYLEPLKNISFENLINSLNRLWEALSRLGGTIFSGLEWFYFNILVPLAEWTIEDLLPAFIDVLTGALNVLNAVLEIALPLLEWFWDTFLEPIANWTGGVIVGILNALATTLENMAVWISNNKTLIEALLIVLGSLALGFGIVNAAILIFNGIVAIGTALGAAFGAVMAFITSPIGLVVLAIGALIAIIVLLVRHWDTVKETAINVIESIKKAYNDIAAWFDNNVLKPLSNGFRNMLNGIVGFFQSAINGVIGLLNGFGFDIPDWIPKEFGGGKRFGFNIAPVNLGSIPMLAEGTVVPKQSGMFAAILGDNNRETEVVSPLSTMKTAVKEAMNENGGDYISAQVLGELQELVMLMQRLVAKDIKVEINDRVVAQSNDSGKEVNGLRLGNIQVF